MPGNGRVDIQRARSVCAGKACVRGLRITVYEVLEYLASEMTEEEILKDFPDLTREDLKACIAFAADRERKLMTVPAA